MADPELPSDFQIKFIIPALYLALGFLVREIWGWYKNRSKDMKTELTAATVAINQLEKTMIGIQFQLKTLNEQITPLIKLRGDVDEAHTKIRELKAELKSRNA